MSGCAKIKFFQDNVWREALDLSLKHPRKLIMEWCWQPFREADAYLGSDCVKAWLADKVKRRTNCQHKRVLWQLLSSCERVNWSSRDVRSSVSDLGDPCQQCTCLKTNKLFKLGGMKEREREREMGKVIKASV